MKQELKQLTMKPLIYSLMAIGLGGCAATDLTNKNFDQGHDQANSIYQGAQTKVSSSATPNDPLSNFSRASKNWINPSPLPKMVADEDRARLPAFFKEKVTYTMAGRVSLVEAISEMQRQESQTKHHVTFNISQDVYNSAGGQGKLLSASGGASAGNANATPLYVNDFVYSGSFENALDLLSAKANISWKWTGSGIKFFRFETKQYSIAALAGDTKTSSSVSMQAAPSSSGSGGGSGGSSSATTAAEQGVNRTSTLSKWTEIRTYLLSLLSPNGTLAVLESAGIITVNDTPAVQELVAKSVKELNAILSKQIYINVDIYAVDTTAADNAGIDWNLMWSTANNKFNLGYSNAGNTATTGSFNIGLLKGPFQGSNVLLNALSTLGRASVVSNLALTTLNNEPSPISSNTQIGYISSVKSTPSVTQGVAPTTEVVQSSVFSGIGLTVTPKIQADGKILIEYALNLNDVQNIKNFTTGTGASATTIQLPTTTNKSILQRASLRSGQTLVLSGFKQNTAKNDNAGVASPNNLLLGGRKNASNDEQYLVITITPYLAQDND